LIPLVSQKDKLKGLSEDEYALLGRPDQTNCIKATRNFFKYF